MGSAAFVRIKSEVLALVQCVPHGYVSTFASLGTLLNVMPRHVAYILANLDDAERQNVPWHRIVAHDGALINNPAKRTAQAALLLNDGLKINNGVVCDLSAHFVSAADLKTATPLGAKAKNSRSPAPRLMR